MLSPDCETLPGMSLTCHSTSISFYINLNNCGHLQVDSLGWLDISNVTNELKALNGKFIVRRNSKGSAQANLINFKGNSGVHLTSNYDGESHLGGGVVVYTVDGTWGTDLRADC